MLASASHLFGPCELGRSFRHPFCMRTACPTHLCSGSMNSRGPGPFASRVCRGWEGAGGQRRCGRREGKDDHMCRSATTAIFHTLCYTNAALASALFASGVILISYVQHIHLPSSRLSFVHSLVKILLTRCVIWYFPWDLFLPLLHHSLLLCSINLAIGFESFLVVAS